MTSLNCVNDDEANNADGPTLVALGVSCLYFAPWVHNYLTHMTPEGEVAVATTLSNNLVTENDDDDGEGGEASMAREEVEGEEAGEEERWYKLGRLTDALRSYANRLACIFEDKLHNNNNNNDNDDGNGDNQDGASGDKRHCGHHHCCRFNLICHPCC